MAAYHLVVQTGDFVTEGDFALYNATDCAVERPNPILRFLKRKRKDHRLVAMALAFPFPFGLVGLHRIYLGCAPYVPVVYIATLGGIFGILPLVDFIILAANKDLDRFINNQNVFMWVK